MTLRLGRDFPVWKQDTPRNLQTPTPSKDAERFIDRYRTDVLCTSCRKVVDAADLCSNCDAPSLRQEQLNESCPQCSMGTFALSHLSVY